MATNIKAVLKDSNNKALANTEAQLFFYTLGGAATLVASGRSNTRGSLSMLCNKRFSGFLPRVLLKVKLSNKWVNASNTPKSYSQRTIDFGTVKLSSNPVLTVAATTLHSIPVLRSGTVALTAADTNKLKLLETKNLQLSNQAKSLTEQLNSKELARKSLENELNARPTLQLFNAEKLQVTSLKGQLAEKDKRITLLERGSGQLGALTRELALKEQQRKQLETDLSKRPTFEMLNQQKGLMADLRAQLTLKDSRIAELEGVVIEGGAVAPIRSKTVKSEDLIFSTSDAISKASIKLAKKGGYRISKASVDLKVVAAANKTDLMLFETADDLARIPSNCFGNVQFDIDLSDNSESTEPTAVDRKMPAVTGYTRQLAERKLEGLEEQLFWYEQQLSSKDPFSTGQIISQHPKANTPLQPDTQIILIIGVAN